MGYFFLPNVYSKKYLIYIDLSHIYDVRMLSEFFTNSL